MQARTVKCIIYYIENFEKKFWHNQNEVVLVKFVHCSICRMLCFILLLSLSRDRSQIVKLSRFKSIAQQIFEEIQLQTNERKDDTVFV